MRTRHTSKSRSRTKDKAVMTLRKAVRKGSALCVVCGKNTADRMYDGKAVCTSHKV